MTAEELARSMEAEALTEEARIVSLLWPVYVARQAKKQDEELSPAIKEWLGLHEGETLVDAEHGVLGRLQRGGGRPSTDVRPLTDEQVLWLKGMGLLDIKWGYFDTLRKAAPSTYLDGVANTPGVRTSPEQWNLHVTRLEDA